MTPMSVGAAPTPPPPAPALREPIDIAGLLLAIGAVAVLAGGLSFSTQSAAKFFLPFLVVAFAGGCWAVYRRQLKLSAEVFFSVAAGLAIYEVWIVSQPRSYGGLRGVVRAWADGDDATIGTVAAICAGFVVIFGALAAYLRDKKVVLYSALGWTLVAVLVGIMTALVYVVHHRFDYFEVLTIPVGLLLIAIGERVLAANERISSAETVVWGLLVLLVPSAIASYLDAISFHALIFTALVVASLVYGTVAKRKVVFYVAPWIFLLYCAFAIAAVADDVKPWVWLMGGGTLVILCGAFWEKVLNEVKAGRSRLSALR